jgi:hypothetical protein
MSIDEAGQPALHPAVPPAHQSPLRPRHLVNLFFRPRLFFAHLANYQHTPYLALVTWCYGMARVIDRIDRLILQAELGYRRERLEMLEPLIEGSWVGYWVWVLGLGVVSAIIIWFLGGWWYWLRLRWSDANSPDGYLARQIYVYSSLIEAAPIVLVTLIYTLVYPDYGTAWNSEPSYVLLLLLLFPFWAVISSYVGVRTGFETTRWKAALWFLVLPISLYLVGIGGILLQNIL